MGNLWSAGLKWDEEYVIRRNLEEEEHWHAYFCTTWGGLGMQGTDE